MKQLLAIFVLLLAITCCTGEADKTWMRSCLDSINQRNRNDLPFTVQDVQPFVHFFDSHGTPNDRLLAHYLLGRAYHEAGEAPMALECYQKAAECADTLSADCDYPQLARVYAQMSQIFYEQGLYRDQIVFQQLSSEYAWKGKDTLAALMSYEQKSQAYFHLNMPDSLLYICEDVSSLYRKYGYTPYAATALGYTLDELVHRKEFEKARRYIQIYESESEFFDSLGNIEKGREIYYYVKGLYFLHTNALDSAEYYFRKELRDGMDFDCQNTGALGLSEIYQKHRRPDSVAKYVLYAYAMLDSMHSHLTSREVKRIQSLYDYTRNQKIAELEREKASERQHLIYILLMVVLLLLALSGIAILKYRQNKQQRVALEEKYQHSLDAIQKARKDISALSKYKEQNNDLIREKEKLIHEQETIRNTMLQNEKVLRENAQKQFKSSTIYRRVIKLADTGVQPSKQEWQELQDTLLDSYPNFSELMTKSSQNLDDREYKICILVRAGISPGAIASMLEIQSSIVTRTRTNLLLKIFGKYGTSKEFDIMLRRIY